jgi:hypothetical protein
MPNIGPCEEFGFVGVGVWLTLALFIPALCLLSVRMRSKKSGELNDGILKKFGLDKCIYYEQYSGIQDASIWRKAWFPILIISTLCIYYASLLVYTFDFVGSAENMGNFLLLGHEYVPERTDKNLDGTLRQSLEVMCFAYLGWYVWAVSTIFSRIVTLELVAATFWSILIRLVIAVFVALMFRFLLPGLPWIGEHSKLLAEGIGFGVGLFPDSALQFLADKLHHYLLDTGAGTEELPLELIQGVSSFRKLRLFEMGLDNCQNLASINAIELYFTSNLKLVEVIDWIAQAQLVTLVGKNNFKTLLENGYRNAIDFHCAAKSPGAQKVLEMLIKFPKAQLECLATGMENSPSFNRLMDIWALVLKQSKWDFQSNDKDGQTSGPEPAGKNHEQCDA